MPEYSDGDILQLRAYYDEKASEHKLENRPEPILVCKRKTRVVAIVAENQTVNTAFYKPIVLEYRILDSSKIPGADPKRVFSDGPSYLNSSFIVPDDGKPCYFMIKKDLGLKERENPCSFSTEGPDDYSIHVRFAHHGWADAHGSGEHNEFHIES